MNSPILFLVLAAMIGACGPSPSTDAGIQDAGVQPDAAPALDSGVDAGSAPGDGGATLDAETRADASAELGDCGEFAASVCARDACPDLVFIYGSVDRCTRAFETACRVGTGPDTNATPAMWARCYESGACGSTATTASCELPPGTRALGDPCSVGTQCGLDTDGHPLGCDPGAPDTAETCEVGRCVRAALLSEPCETVPCDVGLGCVRVYDPLTGALADDRTCERVTWVGVDQACALSSDRVCQNGLFCDAGTCRPTIAEGGDCDVIEGGCAPEGGLFCVSISGDPTDPDYREGRCEAVERLLGEECASEGSRCPFYTSACEEGVCVDIATPLGGECTSIVDCESGVSCIEGRCRYPGVCG